jgi:uncharacterized repeat protein (TIGR02543 family)
MAVTTPPPTKVDFDPTPVLGTLANASYQVNTTENVDLRIIVTNATEIAADGGTLSYQWYKAADDTSDGTETGTDSRDYTPAVDVAGTTYYWAVVTNSKGGQTAVSNKARIIIYTPTGDSDIEKITAANAAMPLWEFTLPAGASWADYEEFSIEYYVSKDSQIVENSVRSRLYGAYLAGDFVVPDQGDINGWGGFRMVSWNTNPMTNEGRQELNANPNNDFIIDNSRGSAVAFSALFTAEGGGASKWFTVKYTTNAGLAKDFAKVPLLDSETVNAIYVGAGIFGPGGDGTNNYEFYVKNPTLINKSDPTLNIQGAINASGTTEKLFAGNLGSPKAGTDREVVTEYEDVEGEIMISFNLAGGTGDFPPARIMEGESLGDKFPSTEPTRDGFTFLGWYDGEVEEPVTAETVFEVKTTLTAHWELTATVETYVVDLSEQTTKNETAWTGNYSSGLVLALGEDFDVNFYDTVEITCKFYGPDGAAPRTEIAAGNFQLKWHAGAVENANGTAVKTTYNFGNGGAIADDGSVTVTLPVPSEAKAGLWGFGIQTSSNVAGDNPISEDAVAQFIEVLSITFPVAE